ncbi:PRC-barrel domain-containing protein, partial [Pseudonocardia sp.]|uniref:PRC-barrel domain-containing protein n=1 Tax=Pseudonocardia sp. TaxID=60912 RepID=UPI0031FBDC90
MTSANDLRDLIGSTAYDRSGDRIGKIGQIYYDDDTDQPKWVTVQTGLFGTRESFVPVQNAEIGGDRVTGAAPPVSGARAVPRPTFGSGHGVLAVAVAAPALTQPLVARWPATATPAVTTDDSSSAGVMF